jgi:hypothetical protein
MGVVDIENAQATIIKTLDNGQLVLTQGELDAANRLLKEYGQKREDLHKAMVLLIDRYDPSGLDNDWKDCCSKGRDALNNLNNAVPQGSGGLNSIGLNNFYRGEMSIWNENSRAEIALAAKQIKTIHLANLKLIQDCNEDLKKVLSDKADVQKFVEGTFGGITDVLSKTVTFLIAIVQIEMYKGQPSIPDQVKILGEKLKQSYAQAVEAAAKKQALMKILLARIALLKDLKSRLNKDAIRAAKETGMKTAESLYVAGRDAPYEARDWEEFGKNCKEKLADDADRSTTDADTLFDLLYNRLDEETAKSFEALSDEPAQWERWRDDIGKSFNSIQEAFANEQKYVDTLAESKIKQGLNAAMADARAMIKVSLDDWEKTKDEIKSKLKKD